MALQLSRSLLTYCFGKGQSEKKYSEDRNRKENGLLILLETNSTVMVRNYRGEVVKQDCISNRKRYRNNGLLCLLETVEPLKQIHRTSLFSADFMFSNLPKNLLSDWAVTKECISNKISETCYENEPSRFCQMNAGSGVGINSNALPLNTIPAAIGNVECSPFRIFPTVHCDNAEYDRNTGVLFHLNWFQRDPVPLEKKPKVYNVKLKPLISALSPKFLLGSALVSILINFSPVLESHFLSEEPLSLPTLVAPAKKCIWTTAKEILKMATRRVLERVVNALFSPRWTMKLVKDYYYSAVRKARRGFSGFSLCYKVSVTVLRSTLLSVVSSVLVNLVIDSAFALRRVYLASLEARPEVLWLFAKREGNLVLLRMLRLSVISCVCLLTGCVGAGIGSVIAPGRGTWIGAFIGDNLGPVLITAAMSSVL